MKNIVILMTLFLTFTFLGPAPVFAQEQSTPDIVVATPYKTGQKLDFFFQNSKHPLLYLEEPGEEPIFVSIITPVQKQAYIASGYKPRIIDQTAGSIDQYYIMYTQKLHNPYFAKKLQGQTYKEGGIEIAYQLSKYNTFLKLQPGKAYSQLNFPILARQNARQLHWDLVPPVDKTNVSVQKTENDNRFVILSLLLIGIIIGIFIYTLKRKK